MKVKNTNGIEIDCTNIHDLWHVATVGVSPAKMHIRNANTGKLISGEEAILEVWSQAHAMKAEIERLRAELEAA